MLLTSLIDHEERFSESCKVRAVMLWWDDSPAKQWDKNKNKPHQALLEQSKKLHFKDFKL